MGSRKRPKLADWGDGNVKVKQPRPPKLVHWGDGNGRPPKRSKKSKSDCFVATAAYRSHSHPTVVALRNYRDQRLQKTTAGQCFIRFYYLTGPVFAKLLYVFPVLGGPVRYLLSRLVDRIEHR